VDFFEAVFETGHPEQVLVIAQAAAAILDIRLLHVDHVAVLGVPFGLVLDARHQVGLDVGLDALLLETGLELGIERLVAPQEARVEQRGFGHHLLVGLGDGFVEVARRFAGLHAAGGEDAEHLLDEFHEAVGEFDAPRMQEREIEIAAGIQLAAAVAAHNDEGDLEGFGAGGGAALGKNFEEMDEPGIHDVGPHAAEGQAGVFLALLLEPAVVGLEQTLVGGSPIGERTPASGLELLLDVNESSGETTHRWEIAGNAGACEESGEVEKCKGGGWPASRREIYFRLG
jgi:hypothetical protein